MRDRMPLNACFSAEATRPAADLYKHPWQWLIGLTAFLPTQRVH
jgi:hypothetical protein